MKKTRKCKFRTFDRQSGWSDLQDGYFHQWGTQVIETAESMVQETIGIIEDTSGVIHIVTPSKVEF